MTKYNKEELELVKNYIKENYCGSGWTKLYQLGCIIFEEFITDGVCFLKIKNKCFWIDYEDNDLETIVSCINIEDVKKSDSQFYTKKFKLDWFINILAKNDRVVEYLYGKI